MPGVVVLYIEARAGRESWQHTPGREDTLHTTHCAQCSVQHSVCTVHCSVYVLWVPQVGGGRPVVKMPVVKGQVVKRPDGDQHCAGPGVSKLLVKWTDWQCVA